MNSQSSWKYNWESQSRLKNKTNTLYSPMPGSIRNERADVDGKLEDPLFTPCLILFLQLVTAQGPGFPSFLFKIVEGTSDSERIKS